MKQFLKFMFASMLGVILSGFLLVFFFALIIGGAISSASKEKESIIQSKSILHLQLDQPIHERGTKNPFAAFNLGPFNMESTAGLDEIMANIEKAKKDDRIQGIYLDVSAIPAGIATVEEIRNALIDFKTSKKFIIAYSETYTQGAYYLASVADEIYMNPMGGLDFRGLKAEIMFYKGALEKLEIEPEIIRHGKFKSAIEPFILSKMSDANRKQIGTFVGSIWNYLLTQISDSRHISADSLQLIANGLLVDQPEEAIKHKMIDKLAYQDEVYDILRKKLGLSQDCKISFVSLKKYADARVSSKSEKLAKDKIAIVYAEGEIMSGKGDDNTIGSDRISEAIRKARMDEKIKAIVLRVNSPGGSALASDVIWREVALARKQKPVVVSMGNVAASGGYYIACAASEIIAEPNTITGSIGVFGLLFNGQKLLNNKLGITVDTFKTATYADMGSMYRPLTAAEKDKLQRSVERTYDVFISRVAEGRKMSKANVDSIGQGRVWSAIDAQKIGLVDELGGIKFAIKEAAKLAKISKYRIVDLPELKDPFQKIIEELTGDVKTRFIKEELGQEYRTYQDLHNILNMRGIQARMPYNFDLH